MPEKGKEPMPAHGVLYYSFGSGKCWARQRHEPSNFLTNANLISETSRRRQPRKHAPFLTTPLLSDASPRAVARNTARAPPPKNHLAWVIKTVSRTKTDTLPENSNRPACKLKPPRLEIRAASPRKSIRTACTVCDLEHSADMHCTHFCLHDVWNAIPKNNTLMDQSCKR